MKAIFFGSIGTIVETSHLQLKAFNAAFKFHKLDWRWSREVYEKMLKLAGGEKRIETYALLKNEIVDAKKIHDTKSRIFQTLMSDTHIEPRHGVRDIIDFAQNERLKLGFVTTTSRKNVDQILSTTQLMPSTFDVIISADQVAQPKPSASAYNLALKKLGLLPHDVIAVEDNRDGYRSAKSADLKCFVNPGAFHDKSAFDATADISADPAGSIMSAVKHTIAAWSKVIGFRDEDILLMDLGLTSESHFRSLLESDEREMSVVISDPFQKDNPMIFVSDEFEKQTGYTSAEAIGQNCRFLQGEYTSPHAIEAIRQGLLAQTRFTIDILNYRKSGEPFVNRLRIRPIYDGEGRLIFYAGAQNPV